MGKHYLLEVLASLYHLVTHNQSVSLPLSQSVARSFSQSVIQPVFDRKIQTKKFVLLFFQNKIIRLRLFVESLKILQIPYLQEFGNLSYVHLLIILYGIFLSSAYTYWAYFTILQKFSVNIISISVMAVPILAILVDYIFTNVQFSKLDFLALLCIISGIYIVAKKPFN